jgi:hypothetical protein
MSPENQAIIDRVMGADSDVQGKARADYNRLVRCDIDSLDAKELKAIKKAMTTLGILPDQLVRDVSAIKQDAALQAEVEANVVDSHAVAELHQRLSKLYDEQTASAREFDQKILAVQGEIGMVEIRGRAAGDAAGRRSQLQRNHHELFGLPKPKPIKPEEIKPVMYFDERYFPKDNSVRVVGTAKPSQMVFGSQHLNREAEGEVNRLLSKWKPQAAQTAKAETQPERHGGFSQEEIEKAAAMSARLDLVQADPAAAAAVLAVDE